MFSNKIFITLFLIIVSPLSITAQVLNGDFWVLQADHKTSDAIINAISDPKLDAEKINTNMKSLIKRGKITELARFKQRLDDYTMKMEKLTGEIKFKTIQAPAIPMGVFIQAKVVFNDKSKAYDLSYTASILEKEKEGGKEKKKGISHYMKELKTTVSIINNDWLLLSQWRNETDSTLLLARFSGIPDSPADAKVINSNVYTDMVLLKTSQINLKALSAANPKAREKAILKLKTNSEFFAGATITSKQGEDASYSDIYNCVFGLRSDAGDYAWEIEPLGLTWKVVASPSSGKENDRVVDGGSVHWEGSDTLQQKVDDKQNHDIFLGMVFEENYKKKLNREKIKFLGSSKYVDNPSQFNSYRERRQIIEGLLPDGQFRILELNRPNNKSTDGLIMLLTIKNK